MGTMMIAVAGLLGMPFLLAGCAASGADTEHEMVSEAADYPIGCQKCYDEVKRVRKAAAGGQKWRKTQVIRKHKCSDCKAEMSTYTVDGQPMIKCPKCAPEGMACDRCLPPKQGT
jgi:hypothetical protein